MSLLSLKQVADQLKVSIQTVRRYIADDKLTASKIGKEYRVSEDNLNSFITDTASTPPHPHPKPPRIKHNQLYNFTATEALIELAPEIDTFAELEDFIQCRDPQLGTFLQQIEDVEQQSVQEVIRQLVRLEAETSKQTHQQMYHDLHQESVVVLFPLPPKVINAIEAQLSENVCFNTEKAPPKHIQHLEYQPLTVETMSESKQRLQHCTSMIVDGKHIDDMLVVRPAVAALLNMIGDQLETVFFHRIPHIPKGQKFTSIHTDQYQFAVRYI